MEPGPSALGGSLHDELLQGFQDTGMYEYGVEYGIIQDGEIPEVRLRGGAPGSDAATLSTPTPQQYGATSVSGCDRDAVLNGQRLVMAADAAIAEALKVGETTRARLAAEEQAANSMEDVDDPMQGTPPKARKKRSAARGMSSTGSDGHIGGRNNGKGLRHFSMKVCEKVESKGRTTYNEVADELVQEFSAPSLQAGSPGGAAYDEKNIRRRVYDALNVLMAMDIITKDKKEISWQGLPPAPASTLEKLKAEKARLIAKLHQQHNYLKETSKQHAAYRNLIMRHLDRPASALASMAAPNGAAPTALPLPFILIQVNPEASVEIQIADDNRQAMFDFAGTCFRIMGDDEVLYEMNLHMGADGMFPQPQLLPMQPPAAPPSPAIDSAAADVAAAPRGAQPRGAQPQLLVPMGGGAPSAAAQPGQQPASAPGARAPSASSLAGQHQPPHIAVGTQQLPQGMGQPLLPPATWTRPQQQMFSTSSARAMEEGTPPDSAKSAGAQNGRVPHTPPSGGSLTGSIGGTMDLSPGGLVSTMTGLSSSQGSLMSPPPEMVGSAAQASWRWADPQNSAGISHASTSTPTAPTAQHLQELMHQMQANAAQGFPMAAAYSSQGFPIASLDAAGHPHMRQWRQ
ncbi:probable transcription factor Dp-1 at N-terminal half [Coccomyxa sp. Obi]|nr:probable transcription factor Dp-1 at N-terminal half [Coccomyxa sp. Obi]